VNAFGQSTAVIGRAALVTGCSSGIGRAIAIALADRGAIVCATARDIEAIADLADRARIAHLDVRDPVSIGAALALAGPPDILVNNAGFGIEGAIEEIDDADLQEEYDTNVFGVWRTCRAVLPAMRVNSRGTIVNVSSFGGQAAFPGIGAYRSSKFALEGLTWTLRLEVAHFGIRVLSVQPGLTASRFGDAMRPGALYEPDGPYAPMRVSAAAAYPRMSPVALEPEVVAEAVVDAIETEQTPWRIRIGADAEYITSLVEEGVDVYERHLVEDLGFDWHPLGNP
jgi:NAD(P)-dependent dehydrogenase (short-subunit alcohol dehydrogenase family)